MKRRLIATLIVLATIVALTAVAGCSPKSVADVTRDAGSAMASANGVAERGLITIYQPPG